MASLHPPAMADVAAAISAGILGTMYVNARTHFSKDFFQLRTVIGTLLK